MDSPSSIILSILTGYSLPFLCSFCLEFFQREPFSRRNPSAVILRPIRREAGAASIFPTVSAVKELKRRRSEETWPGKDEVASALFLLKWRREFPCKICCKVFASYGGHMAAHSRRNRKVERSAESSFPFHINLSHPEDAEKSFSPSFWC